MSGFEVIGVILGLYPIIGTALVAYKATKGGKGAKKLIRDLKVEKVIFRDFVHNLLAPNVTEAELVRLKDLDCHDATSWTNAAVAATGRLGLEKATLIIEILLEICDLLKSLQTGLSPSNRGTGTDHGVDLLRKFHASCREFKNCLPKSSVKDELDQLTAYNHQLQRLFTDQSLPANTAFRKRIIQSRRYLHRDSSHAATNLYKAICSGYRCECDVPHFANFGLPQISDVPRTDSRGLTEDRQFELLFPSSDSEKKISDAASGYIRRISICECDKHPTDEQHGPTTDLCIFLRTLDQHNNVSNARLGIWRLEEKLYEVQAPRRPSQNIVCLDELLTNQPCLLSRRERITLALRLSYAILQFYFTPWIEACWTWEDLCMDRQNDLELFVIRKFYSSCSGIVSSNSSPKISEFLDIHGEPILTRLGYALIELALGKKLAQLRSENQYKSKDPDMLDFLTAKDVVKSGRIMESESRGYENVVKACLFHQFLCMSDLKEIDSRDDSFHEDVERCIIAPLHTLWTASWGDS